MRRIPLILGLVLASWSAHAAAGPAPDPGQAEATVREVLARVLSPVLKATDKAGDDRRFLTPDLYAAFQKGAQAFDADPYTGSQEPESFSLRSLSRTTAKDPARIDVTATFAVTGFPDSKPRITYRMRHTGMGWRIDDIRYHDDEQSMRGLLRRGPSSGP